MSDVERWAHVRFVYDVFKRDLEQGYCTRDKEFAVHMLGQALNIPDEVIEDSAYVTTEPYDRGPDWRIEPGQARALAFELCSKHGGSMQWTSETVLVSGPLPSLALKSIDHLWRRAYGDEPPLWQWGIDR